ncbi:MAG: nitroreductase [Deltaproteobacteria bacterium]|nr:nitroreductase [Deltaproteobacteria bacterium]
MELIQAITERKSIRAFKPDPVPKDLLGQILEKALRAPSWANTQPWQFAAVTGEPLDQIRKGFLEKLAEEPHPDIARPYAFPDPYLSRINALPSRNPPPTQEDMDLRRVLNYRHYGAPAVLYLLVDRSFVYQSGGINVWSLYDCGAVVQNIMLLATSHGLGTIAQAQAVVYPEVIRGVIGIPDSRLIALGIAIGYPDLDHPLNQPRTAREPLDEVAAWYGFQGSGDDSGLATVPHEPADRIWAALSGMREKEFIDAFNRMKEVKRREVAEYVLTQCNVFSGNAMIFSGRYDEASALME